jgi:CRP/FNR family transcriptional regulator
MTKVNYCKKNDIEQCLARRVLCICNVILQHPLFAGIEREETHKLSAIADVIHREKGEYVLTRGAKAEWIYFVLEGSVKNYARDDDSDKEFIHSVANRSDAIGLEYIFDNDASYDFSIQSLVKSTILMLRRESFAGIISKSPVISQSLIKFLSRDLQVLKTQVEDLVLDDVSDRVLDYLYSLGSNRVLELPLSKADTAALLGTVPETFSRALKCLQKSGKISKISKNQITLACN